jgi:cation:H+ antiporter
MVKSILLILVGFVLLIKGADFLVNGASGIAKKFGIPEMIVGLTIVSIGTSMPELFVSLTSSLKGYSDVSIGNVIGSNLCNLLLILGITACIRDIKFEKNTKYIEIPFLLGITFLFFCFGQDGVISRVESIILIILFICFIMYTIITAKSQKNPEEELEQVLKEKNISVIKSIFEILIGIVALKFGGDFVVENATSVARTIGISDKIISVTIIAIGTSLPELVTSVVASIKGSTDMAIGNIIGSNIFNLLLIIGVTAVINPVIFNLSYNFDLICLFIATLILFIIPHAGKKEYMTKWGGFTFLAMYIVYMVHLLV